MQTSCLRSECSLNEFSLASDLYMYRCVFTVFRFKMPFVIITNHSFLIVTVTSILCLICNITRVFEIMMLKST
jgi:hypothetical protein